MNPYEESDDIKAFREAVRVIHREQEELLVAKRLSYGTGNLSRRGTAAIVIRAEDKLERLWNMAMAGEVTTATNESRDDAWSDLMGYATLGKLLERGHRV